MADASPTKWHRAHTTWFFEEFVLAGRLGRPRLDPDYRYLFNSYYEAVGPRQPRPRRGMITRPDVAEVGAYRVHVDEALHPALAAGGLGDDGLALVELGLHHEQQHQELLLMDAKHLLWQNPLHPAYRSPAPADTDEPDRRRRSDLLGPPGCSSTTVAWWIWATTPVAATARGSPTTTRAPRHRRVAGALRPRRPPGHLRRVAGLHGRRRLPATRAVAERRLAPAGHGSRSGRPALLGPGVDGAWHHFTLGGLRPVDPAEPVAHVQLPRGRCLRPLGRRTAPHGGRVGGRGPGALAPTRAGSGPTLHPAAAGAPGADPLAAHRRGLAVDVLGLPPLPRLLGPPPARSASTTASSWSTSTSCGAAPR